MYNGRQAYDTGTGRDVDTATAERAADNPMIYKWIAWR